MEYRRYIDNSSCISYVTKIKNAFKSIYKNLFLTTKTSLKNIIHKRIVQIIFLKYLPINYHP